MNTTSPTDFRDSGAPPLQPLPLSFHNTLQMISAHSNPVEPLTARPLTSQKMSQPGQAAHPAKKAKLSHDSSLTGSHQSLAEMMSDHGLNSLAHAASTISTSSSTHLLPSIELALTLSQPTHDSARDSDSSHIDGEVVSKVEPVEHPMNCLGEGDAGRGSSSEDKGPDEPGHVVSWLEEMTPSPTPARSPNSRKRKPELPGGGRPKSPRKHELSGPTRLRKGKPVESEVPMDVWELVLPYCPGRFMARARRINKSFYRALSYESAWRKNRMQNHGEDLPGPFPGMQEDEYANLLEGLGCMDCGNPKTRKTYWLWQKRWCIPCLHKNTLKHEAAITLLLECPELLEDVVPYGLVDAWGCYEMAGMYDRVRFRQGHPGQKVYRKADIFKALAEWESMRPNVFHGFDKTPSEVQWWRAKKKERDQLMERCQKIEIWLEKRTRDKLTKNKSVKAQRVAFFEERAKELDPPIELAALYLIPAFVRSIDIAKVPSERAWKALLPKLLQVGSEAQEELKITREARVEEVGPGETHRWHMRENMRLPELVVLKRIAKEVVGEMTVASPPIADVDFALFALRTIRQRWVASQERGEDADCKDHQLKLADALWTWDHEIRPIIAQRGDRSTRKLTKHFKCPACIRGDVNARFSLEGLFVHLRNKHAKVMGPFRSWFGPGPHPTNQQCINSFEISWPMNLPVLADHHVASGKWDPNDQSPYVLLAAAEVKVPRVADVNVDRLTRVPEDASYDLTENIIYAGKLLKNTALDPMLKTKIVLRYALNCYKHFNHGQMPPNDPEDIQFLPLDLFKADLGELFEGFRCNACIESEPRLSRYSAKVRSPSTLFDHFRRWHSNVCWYTSMIEFPSDDELSLALREPGMETTMQVYDALFPRNPRAVPTHATVSGTATATAPSHQPPIDPALLSGQHRVALALGTSAPSQDLPYAADGLRDESEEVDEPNTSNGLAITPLHSDDLIPEPLD